MTPITVQEQEKILTYLETRLEPGIYDIWCRQLTFEAFGDNAVRVPTANPYYRDWLEKLIRKPLEDAFQNLFGRVPEIVFQVTGAAAALFPPAAASAPFAPPPVPPPVPEFVFNPAYTFENFVEGPSNRMAYAASVAVSESPAKLYNPLFIHGGVGLGKTHLLQAICHSILKRNPSARVLYLSCEDFVNGFIYALQNKQELEPFRCRYRNADVLVVDDIHFLVDKKQSQEEFFHTFNALHLAGRQMILSSDQPAQDLRSLSEQLLSRFRSGFEAKISHPTYEMRLAILRRKADARWKDIPQDVLGYVASAIQTNIRELEGGLTKVMGYAALSNRPPDLDLAKEVLRDTQAMTVSPLSISEIQSVVARYFNKKVSELQSKRSTRSTSLARQVSVYLCRKLTPASLDEIGGHFGGRDHSTILHSINKIESLVSENGSIRGDVERLTRELTRR
jgi:chromosomal replication initiator protein